MPILKPAAKSRGPSTRRFFKVSSNKKTVLRPKRPIRRKTKAKPASPPADSQPSPLEFTPESPMTPRDTPASTPDFSPPPPQPKDDAVLDTGAKQKPQDEDINELQRLIQSANDKLGRLEEERHKELEKKEQQIIHEDPEEYNGLSSDHEVDRLLEERLQRFERENTKLKHQLEVVKTDFETDKKKLETTIKNLKQELHRTTPIQDNKFFTISKEIREAVNAIEQLTKTDLPDDSSEPMPPIPVNPQAKTLTVNAPAPEKQADPKPPPKPESTQEAPSGASEETIPPHDKPEPSPSQPEKDEKKPKKSKLKEKKLLITGGAAIAVLTIGGLVSLRLASKPKVDQQLVENYLNEQGQVAGIQSKDPSLQSSSSKANEGVDKYAEVPFDQTEWEHFRDDIFGIQLEFPIGLVERMHNTSTITFLRKDSYIFRVQKTESALELEAYWEQNKSNSLNYISSPVELKGKPALYLKLEDQASYPGDRYLIKNGTSVYDIWLATPSDKFSVDDVKRAEHMLSSLTFL